MTYRPDIDGLRAVAVIAVILFHLNSAWLPGGFLGVDIFFVISGYLIGGILYRELTTKTFSLKRFYLRRMRRILPAFFAVVVFSLLVGSFWMLPGSDEWNTTRSTAKWSALFAGNLFSSMNVDYWATSTEVQPLNHLWSLAVEEQFYFLYPLLLWGLMALLRRMSRFSARMSARSLVLALVSLAILSFALSFFPLMHQGKPLIAYYLPHLRFGELLIGAILSVVVANGAHCRSSRTAVVVGSISVLLLLVCLLLPFPNSSPWFPGFAAAVPCVASAGIIYAGAQNYWFSRLLSQRAVVYVGKISYSLYLWHWPVLAFAHYLWGTQLPPLLFALACVVIVAMSLLSYYLIEQPLRHWQWAFGRTALAYYLVPLVVTGGLYLRGKEMPKSMLPYTTRGSYNVSEKALGYTPIGDSTAQKDVLVVGNSYTMQLYEFFNRVGKSEGWSGVLSGVSGTFPAHLSRQQPISSADFQRQLDKTTMTGNWRDTLNTLRSRRIAADLPHYRMIVISLNWWHPEFVEKSLPNVLATIAYLRKKGKKVVLVNSCMTYTTYRIAETYQTVTGGYAGFSHLLPDRYLRDDRYSAAEEHVRKVRERVAARFPEVRWVDLVPYIPTSLLYKGKTVLCNTTHLNMYGANYLADRFIADGQRLIDAAEM